jgi:hypothetical protein
MKEVQGKTGPATHTPYHSHKAWGSDAEALYLRGNTLETIQKITGISMPALSAWKNRYNWEEKRALFEKQPQALCEKIGELLSKLLENVTIGPEGIGSLADDVSKLASAQNRLEASEDMAGMVVTVMDKFLKFIRSNCPEAEENFKDALYGYIQRFFDQVKKEYAK